MRRLSKTTESVQVWHLEDKIASGLLLARYRLEWDKAKTPSKLSVEQYPVLSRKRDFALDVSGLPPLIISEEQKHVIGPLVTLKASDFAADLNGPSGTGGPLSAAIRTSLLSLVRAALPMTMFDLPDPAVSTVEEDDGRWTIPVAGNPHWSFLTIRRASSTDLEVDPPGVSRRYGGTVLSALNVADPVNMPKLRADLRAMGFELVPVAGNSFDEPLRAGVREFQAYARRAGGGHRRAVVADAGHGAGRPDL